MGNIARTTAAAFVLFLVLVWLANTLGVALAQLGAGKLPPQVLGVLDPHRAPAQAPQLIGDTPTF